MAAKKRSKILAAIIAFMMVFAMMPQLAIPVHADSNHDNAEAICLGEEKTVVNGSGYLKFIPSKSGVYDFSFTDEYRYCDVEVRDEKNNSYKRLFSAWPTNYGYCDFSLSAEAGETYWLAMTGWGRDVTVSLNESSITGISYKLAKPIILREGVDCEFAEPGYNRYRYNVPGDGDELTVNTNEGSRKYIYDKATGYFFDENRHALQGWLDAWDDQQENHWEKGEECEITIYYKYGVTCTVPAEVVDNTITKLVYQPKIPVTFYPGQDYYVYKSKGDKLVFTENGKDVIYEFDSDSNYFINTDDEEDKIPGEDLRLWIDRSSSSSWLPGGEYSVEVRYKNYRGEDLTVRVLEEPSVDSISFTPVRPYELVLEKDGYWSNGSFIYFLDFRDGDKLTLITAAGNKDFVYDYWRFMSEDGATIFVRELNKDQSSMSSWTVGSDNSFTITYRGKTLNIPVTIKPNNVTAIAFEPVESYIYSEDDKYSSGYSLPSFNDGDKLTLIMEGASKEYFFDRSKYGFIDEEGSDWISSGAVIFSSDQSTTPWTTWGDNILKVTCMSKTCTVPVEVLSETDARVEAVRRANALIAEVEKLDPDDYTWESYIDIPLYIQELKNYLNDSSSTADGINSGIRYIRELVSKLVKIEGPRREAAVKAAEKAINRAKAMDSSEYAKDVYDAVQDLMRELENLIADESSTSQEINKLTEKLNDAVDFANEHPSGAKHVPYVKPGCDKPGNIEHWTVTKDGVTKYYRDYLAIPDNLIDMGDIVIPKTIHSWDAGKVTKQATTTETGVKTYTCTACRATKSETIPKLQDQTGADGTPVGTGASAEAAEKAITTLAKDADPKGTVFARIQLKSPSQTKTSVKISWKKTSGATKYVIYGNACGAKNKMKKLATVTGSSKNFTKVAGKKVKKGSYYKFMVVALDKNNKVVSTSKMIHVATKGGKVGNHKSVTVKAKIGGKTKAVSKVTLKKGKILALKTKLNPASKKLKVKKHVGVRYESSNNKIAAVNGSGKITAKAKGTCYIYVYAPNGVMKAVKVMVK